MSEAEQQAGDAPPEGSQEEGGEQKKGSDNRIPLYRVHEMIANAVAKAKAEFSATVAEATKAKEAEKAAQPAQQYTKAQLNEFVEEGKLSQDAADQLWENQLIDRASRKATEAATRAVESREQRRTITQQMAEFQNLVPDAWVDGTPEREQVADAFRALKAAGVKGGKDELELAALIAAFGEPDKIRRARGFGRGGPAESFEDSGGPASRSRGSGSNDADAPPKGLSAREVAHYSKRIGSVYKDWNEVREELKFANKQRRA